MQILSFVNQKGGCGKTTAAVNLAGALALRGLRTLVVDIDPQAHATMALGCAPGSAKSAIDVLSGNASLEEALVAASGGVWLLPATLRLAEFEEIAARLIHPESALREALKTAGDVFDLVLVDCPPRADGVLAKNALRASDTAILVVETGAFALQGALQAVSIFEGMCEADDRGFELRVLATLFDPRASIAREILIALQARFGPALFDTAIRTSVRLREAAALGAPVQVVDPASTAADDFAALAEEILAARAVQAPGVLETSLR